MVKQTMCRNCCGVKKMTEGRKELTWQEAAKKYGVVPDAWCIC